METEQDSSNRIGLRVTAFSAMGSRKYMEDTFSVAYQKTDNGKELDYSYFGIFDGHGGDTASIFAKNHLMNFIVDQPGFWSTNDAEVLQAIKKGFIDCHMAMWKDLDKWPPTASGLPSTAGTTASIAFLRKGKLYIGQCGDSGIVLGRHNSKGGKWLAHPLTAEHKPESPEELVRIESFGGKVQQKQGIHRVVWYRPKNPHQGPIRRNTRIEEVPFLAVARSLGDLWSYNYKTQKFVVSPEPDVDVIEVNQSFKCLIFASDGLWNVVDPESAVDSIYETERRNDQNAKLGINNWRNPSRVLVEAALEKWRSNGLRADNTSVVCVMLDEPNKKNMFKFCRNSNNQFESNEMQEGSRTIFDYSTSEAYNLDYMSSDVYGNESMMLQSANANVYGEGHSQFYEKNFHQQSYANNYNNYESSYGFQMPSTSSQQLERAPVTYQTSSNESAFVKACCRNNYQLAGVNDQIPYHSSYEQHRAMYEDMALRPYPPLHYAYRPVATPQHPLPSLHANLYDHQGYQHNYKPMERYNYLRPTPEEVAALHNEEDEDDDSDSNTMEFSDEDSDQEETIEKTEPESSENSIQIFEITSSSLNELEKNMTEDSENSNDESGKPTKSYNKENTEASTRKKKVPTSGRFYATRQTDRKMRSGNVGSSGITKTIKRDRSQRRLARNIRKIGKSLLQNQQKPIAVTVTTTVTKLIKKIPSKMVENNATEKRVLRRAPVKEADTTARKSKCDKIVRSLRSNSNNSNVMGKREKRENPVR